MNKKILFFTCAYNAAPTLRRTIDSIRSQTYGNWMYYVLDNGSSDETSEIIREYEAIDERIHRLRAETNDILNLYLPFSRNEILPETEYDYLAISDADDAYMPEFAEETLNFAEKNGLDFVIASVDRDTSRGVARPALDGDFIFDDDAFGNLELIIGLFASVWGKLYHRSLVESIVGAEGEIRFDFDVFGKAFTHCKRAGILKKIMYRWFDTPTSATYRFVSTGSNMLTAVPMYYFRALETYAKTRLGPLSKKDEDALYLHYANIARIQAGRIYAANIPIQDRYLRLSELLSHELTAELINRRDFGAESPRKDRYQPARDGLFEKILFCVAAGDRHGRDDDYSAVLETIRRLLKEKAENEQILGV